MQKERDSSPNERSIIGTQDCQAYRITTYLTFVVVCICIIYSIAPMIVLREDYVFPIHDGLDSYAGLVNVIRSNGSLFSLDFELPVMNGINSVYLGFTYNLYDSLNLLLGFVPGQIINRVISVVGGFVAMFLLLKQCIGIRSIYDKNIMLLISIAYAITPCASNRTIAFATLPLAVYFFIILYKKPTFSPLSFALLLYAFFSAFNATLLFIIGFWFLATCAVCVMRKKVNGNLVVAFVCLCISCVAVNINLVRIAFSLEESNRALTQLNGSFYSLFKTYLLHSQYHAPTLHETILLPVCFIGTVYAILRFLTVKGTDDKEASYFWKNQILFLGMGWAFWILGACVIALRESGFTFGIPLIDGFNFGRVIALMRLVWYGMFSIILLSAPKKILTRTLCFVFILFQLVVIGTSDTIYNDSRKNILCMVQGYQSDASIRYSEFFSEEQFDKIKTDLNYNGEGVVAYGFHPSVLMHNGFITLDGYASIHSMKWQNEFREIIAPALDRYPRWKSYYDDWGGRMYIFGELSYEPTRKKDVPATGCFIDIAAFQKYGGKYIISRAPISNADMLHIKLIGDYDQADSIYHLFVYSI